MSDLPAPLVPAEVDLRDVPFPVMDMARAFREFARLQGQRTDEDLPH